MSAQKVINASFFAFTPLVLSFILATKAYATGTISGTVKGPHGETAAVNYTFTSLGTGTEISGTTGSDGTFSQTLADGDWSLTISPPGDFTYAQEFTIPRIRIEDGDNFDMGVLGFHFEPGEGADDLEEFGQLPPECNRTGNPVIIRAYYNDEAKGSFLYQGRDAGVTVVADGTNYTVTVDYSFLEGIYQIGSVVENATHQGNGTYTASHTIALATEGGGFPLISVTDTNNSTTTTCLQPGPVNLDIRNHLNGSETTNFLTVSDFRSIENFTMHVEGVVKIAFANSTVNMLDPTVQRFMKSVGGIMLSSKGNVSLDARAVQELRNAGAVITWYNLDDYLTDPNILLDGQEAGSAVSGVTYNRSAGTLTFDASHFSTYTAVPNIEVSSPRHNDGVHSSIIDIKGNVNDPEATTRISVNGVDQGDIFLDSSGDFSKEVGLTSNSNLIRVTATNEIGDAIPYTLIVYAEDPDIVVTWPHEDWKFSTSIINVRGTLSDPYAKVTLKVDGRDQGAVVVDSDGSFDESVEITDYENTITLNAKNDVGDAKQVRITVFNTSVSPTTPAAGGPVLPQTGVSLNYLFAFLSLIASGLAFLSLGLYGKKISRQIG